MNSKKLVVCFVIMALVIALGVAGVFVNGHFFNELTDGKTLIVNVEYLTEEEFGALKTQIADTIKQSGAKPSSEMLIKDLYDTPKGVFYTFETLTDEQIKAIKSLTDYEDISSVSLGSTDKSAIDVAMLWSGIAYAIILVLGFVACVIFFKNTNRVKTGLTVVLLTLFNSLFAFGVISILSFVGLKASATSFGVILAVEILTLIYSTVIFAKLNAKADANSDQSQLIANTYATLKMPISFSAIVIAVACVGLAVISRASMAFALPMLVSVCAVLAAVLFVLLPLWNKFLAK